MPSVIQMEVKYYAVYPGGRRCSVTLEDAKKYGAAWREEGIYFETDVEEKVMPRLGTLHLIRL
jgi:hypothetical protein